MPRAASKTKQKSPVAEVKAAVAALPSRHAPAARLVPVEDILARQAANTALYRKLFAKPAKSKGA